MLIENFVTKIGPIAGGFGKRLLGCEENVNALSVLLDKDLEAVALLVGRLLYCAQTIYGLIKPDDKPLVGFMNKVKSVLHSLHS